MSQYIEILLDRQSANRINSGLYMVIEYIGKQESDPDFEPSKTTDYYDRGRQFLNSRLDRFHGRAISRLVKGKLVEKDCGGDEKTRNYSWKLHKTKAARIFKVIFDILERYDAPEVKKLFRSICEDVFQNAADAVGTPYYYCIKDQTNLEDLEYTQEEIESCKGIAARIGQFRKYYPVK